MKRTRWAAEKTIVWLREHFDYLFMAVVVVIAVLSIASLGRCNVTRQESEFKGVRFDGIHRGADYTLVTFTRDGVMEGRTFATYGEALAFAEAIK